MRVHVVDVARHVRRLQWRSVALRRAEHSVRIIALRPHEFEVGQDVESGFSDGYNDVFTTRGLQSAEFALFTAGPDRKSYDEIRRFDGDDEYNKDNIVKVGP